MARTSAQTQDNVRVSSGRLVMKPRALAGADQTLKGVAVAEAEPSPASLYGGQATLHEVMTQPRSSGFGLIDY
jgi:hypothetical protein